MNINLAATIVGLAIALVGIATTVGGSNTNPANTTNPSLQAPISSENAGG